MIEEFPDPRHHVGRCILVEAPVGQPLGKEVGGAAGHSCDQTMQVRSLLAQPAQQFDKRSRLPYRGGMKPDQAPLRPLEAGTAHALTEPRLVFLSLHQPSAKEASSKFSAAP